MQHNVTVTKAVLTLEIQFDGEITDAESIAHALDVLLETVLSTPDILEEYGNPDIGQTYVQPVPWTYKEKERVVRELDEFTQGYLVCLLWSSNDESDESGGEPLDANYDLTDFTQEALEKSLKECAEFQEANAELLELAGDDSQNGHDFWLTRNGHGAGFWGRGYSESVSKPLTKACEAYGEVYPTLTGAEIVLD